MEQPPATYADLYALDNDLESVDAAATAFQEFLCQHAYKKRAAIAARIPHFWAQVFEQTTQDVDQFIQPSDSEVFASCLTAFSVSRFEIAGDHDAFFAAFKGDELPTEDDYGEPRSFCIRFEFKENDWFEDTVLEKKFWYRRFLGGSGENAPILTNRVSEPVKIHWKKGKDLSDGLTDAACALWEAQRRGGLLDAKGYEDSKTKDEQSQKLPEYAKLLGKVEQTTEGSQSFFTWFSYHGPWVSAARDIAAKNVEKQRNHDIHAKAGENADGASKDEEDAAEEEDLDEMPAYLAVEVFPNGEELALALAEDVWPSAIKYFLQAQEEDNGSQGSFEEADLEEMGEEDLGEENLKEVKALARRVNGSEDGAPAAKKRKT